MKKFIILLFLFPVLVNGQKDEDVGVRFERNITSEKWNSIFERAKKEGKYVFVYINFGNGKKLTESMYNQDINKTFSDKNLSNYFNKKFINIFIEPFVSNDKIFKADPIGNLLLSTYKIDRFPFCLFFDENGSLVHKLYGFGVKDSSFVTKASVVFDKNERYSSLIEQFENGKRDTSFLKKFFNTISLAGDRTDKYVLEFIKSRDNLFTEENAEILISSNSDLVAFDYLYSNQDVWKKIVDTDILENFYSQEIRKQIGKAYYFIYRSDINADELIKIFEEKYPKYGKEASVKFLLSQLRNDNRKRAEWNYVFKTYLDSSFISKSTSSDLNSYAWSVFENILDTTLLNKALSWSNKSLEQDKDNPMYLDTYANLLYKLGQTKEAIEIETKAVEFVKESERKSYQETLDKMKTGKPTWK